ncbi:TIGR04222 domain-containing membrane protein [Umezawaea beigongshangensis]|uniref:TIGR04222 domain-containing membrane protein n=1 Tax=Umezawaea beigongshangensis TaxID=2780383 RepID=UPI0018F2556C|nr:TIGR04222 domain-containing membrane protein [Umezawaea beigongshangensis]
MSEPVLLLLWGVALVGSVACGVLGKRVAGRRSERPLSHEEVGYLGGGPVRAAEVAVAALVSENRARWHGDRLAAVGDPAAPASTPLQALVLTLLHAGPRPVDAVLRAAAEAPPARRVGQVLLRDGLLAAPGQRVRRAVLAVLPLLVVVGAAVAWTISGGRLGAAIPALVVSVVALVVLLRVPPPLLTTAGARARSAATAGLAPVDPAEITARFGLRRPAAAPRTAREQPRDTAVFDGETAVPLTASEGVRQVLPRRRGRLEIRPRGHGALWAAGWFTGGWLATGWLAEGEDDGGDWSGVDFGDEV